MLLDPHNQTAEIGNGTMLAVVWNGHPYNMDVETRAKPAIINATDAIVKVTTAAVCGTDMHVYHGLYGSAEPGWTMGHEAVGYIESVGSQVHNHKVGDYVVIPDNFGTGQYPEMTPATKMTPGYGTDFDQGIHAGGFQGMLYLQMYNGVSTDTDTDIQIPAEYTRVPFADYVLYPIPKASDGKWNTSLENDYVMTSDIFATGWEGVTWSGFKPGDSVAVFGAGPVGQMAAYSAILRGASRVYSVDRIPQRLELAKSIGAIPINYNAGKGSASEQIKALEPSGVIRAVDAVGMESRAPNGSYDQNLVLSEAVQSISPFGGLGVVGVYDIRTPAPGRPNSAEIRQDLSLNIATLFGNINQIIVGGVDARELARPLLQLITSLKASPGYIVSSEINITQAPEYYRRFSNWEETKVLIKF